MREDFDDDFSECLRDDVDDEEDDARVLIETLVALLELLPPG